MKHLPYGHQASIPLAEALLRSIRAMLPARLRRPQFGAGRTNWKGVALCILGWLVALLIQAALLVALAELVELIHGVMNLYLDLAEQQLELTSLYVAATSPA
jgi:hypothetical protein